MLNEDKEDLNRSNFSSCLEDVLRKAQNYLPKQGPIDVFVHHNTLHHFENMVFEEAVEHVGACKGAEPYMSHRKYIEAFLKGKILKSDLNEVISDAIQSKVLPDGIPTFIKMPIEKFYRKLLFVPEFSESKSSIEHCINEKKYLERFVPQVSAHAKERLRNKIILKQKNKQIYSDQRMDSIYLTSLWEWVCKNIFIDSDEVSVQTQHRNSRNDERVNERLTVFLNAYFDLGIAQWTMPNRQEGLWDCFMNFVQKGEKGLPRSIRWFHKDDWTALSKANALDDVIYYLLKKLHISVEEMEGYLFSQLIKLPGWFGTVALFEKDKKYKKIIQSQASLKEILAIRLVLLRSVIEVYGTKKTYPNEKNIIHQNREASLRFQVFHCFQSLALIPIELMDVPSKQLHAFIQILHTMTGIKRRRLLHLAYERTYRNEIMDALASNAKRKVQDDHVRFQALFCIDDREESLRRHLEEIEPKCETYGVAGFFGLDMYFKGIHDDHPAVLCPVSVEPEHIVYEVPSDTNVPSKNYLQPRKIVKKTLRIYYDSTRDYMVGALFTAVSGIFSCIPMVWKIHFPRFSQNVIAKMKKYFFPEVPSTLQIIRTNDQRDQDGLLRGYSIDEIVDRVHQVLFSAGLTSFAPWVFIVGHGSSSLNNPHESAHDCGACSGKRGAPNARAFALMANMPEVRERLSRRGFKIPDQTLFVGGYHDTCSDDLPFFDMELVPDHRKKELDSHIRVIRRAGAYDAHERTRRFEELKNVNPTKALRHVQGRCQSLREPRPEYGHCTNSMCIIGRREMSYGLFLDRRAFLVSYDTTKDTNASVLTQLLSAVIPVCAGINLEYYFSYVDNEIYGCGTKLPHNVTSLIGVMNGGLSDLRTGLPWQMVEIHEPHRLVTIVETTKEDMDRVLTDVPSIGQLVEHGWIQLGIMNPFDGSLFWYHGLHTVEYQTKKTNFSEYSNSRTYYEGKMEHLPPVFITQRKGEV